MTLSHSVFCNSVMKLGDKLKKDQSLHRGGEILNFLQSLKNPRSNNGGYGATADLLLLGFCAAWTYSKTITVDRQTS